MNNSDLLTPCFILDENELTRSIIGFQEALNTINNHCIVGYSLKTNSLPYSLNIARTLGCYAEVVSYDEYELALSCGYDKSHIIYNGPMKSKETFLDSIQSGAIVNIETKRELEWLNYLPKDKTYKIGIRLSINISNISPSDADGDNDISRFGFSDDTPEFATAINTIKHIHNIKLSGLHIHRTTHSRNPEFYRQSVKYASRIIKKYGLSLEYLDVGGGYYGIFPSKPTYLDYSYAIGDALREEKLDHLSIYVEPGNAILASPFTFVSSVIDVKEIGNDFYNVVIDGSRNDIDPFFRKSNYILEIKRSIESVLCVSKQCVSGCTCLENDKLFTLHNQTLLSLNDKLLFKNVGAYTMCLSPMFIRYLPKVYTSKNGKYRLIREEYTTDEFLIKNQIR